MLNKNSVLQENDFTQSEKELIQMHVENCNTIEWETMQEAWRDNEGNLCVRYSAILGYKSSWYHYNSSKKEWW